LKRPAAWIALCAAGVFALLATPRLGAQGVYMDEVFQASGALACIGRTPFYPLGAQWGRLPLMTMGYLGALKSLLYGQWMRLAGFDIVSWRIFGIAAVSLALLAFMWLSLPALRPRGGLAFALLFLTDTTVLLTTRHDWGPVAIALAYRLAWLGLWLRASERGAASTAEAILLGALPGLLLWEKLHYAIFLPAAAAMLLASPAVRVRWRALIAGGVLGALPLLLINAFFRFLSFRGVVAEHAPRSLASFSHYALDMLALGAGYGARSFILGSVPPEGLGNAEAALLAAALVAAGALSWRARRDDPRARWSLACLGAYLSQVVLLYLVPRDIWVHHWIAPTPFQYAAVALSPLVQRPRPAPALLLVPWLCVRLWSAGDTQRSLWKGDASGSYHPARTTIARYAAAHARDTLFVVAEWGFSLQMDVFSQGRALMVEPSAAPDPRQALDAALRAAHDRPHYYLVWDALQPRVEWPATGATRRAAAELARRELPLDAELAGIPGVRKFENPYASH
jgi:hypothetical protein